ncbi:hypothetical protein GCM10010420_17710 [Streptomyces glaucosporus]|uniref:Secreted protein n=1 Tax=Streptomyces glaucosporus TaxID=284044 RepID=A0ABP5V2Z5_9ACTN
MAAAVVGRVAASTVNAVIVARRARTAGRGAVRGPLICCSARVVRASGDGEGRVRAGPRAPGRGCRPDAREPFADYGLEPTIFGMVPVPATFTA